MIERVANTKFEVSLLDKAGNELPEISHQGVTYVVCTAGQEFKVRAVRKSGQWKAGEMYMVDLKVDGRSCGSAYVLTKHRPDCTFAGWWIDHRTKKAFVFSQPPSAEEGKANSGMGSGLSGSKIGTVEVTFTEAEEYSCPALTGNDCSECDFLGFGKRTVRKAAPEETGAIKQAEGKKFFLQPSLGAKGGADIIQGPHTKRRVHDRSKRGGYKHSMLLRFETAPILQLRKISDPSNPSHASFIPRNEGGQQNVGRGQAAPKKKRVGGALDSPPSPKVKQEKKVVKKEKSRSPKDTVIETVDLTDDAHDDQDCMMYTVAKRPKVEGPKLEID